MRAKTRLPKRLPEGAKYVVESCGDFVRRFVELPNGKKIPLPNRKAHTCGCTEQVSIVPEQATGAETSGARSNADRPLRTSKRRKKSPLLR